MHSCAVTMLTNGFLSEVVSTGCPSIAARRLILHISIGQLSELGRYRCAYPGDRMGFANYQQRTEVTLHLLSQAAIHGLVAIRVNALWGNRKGIRIFLGISWALYLSATMTIALVAVIKARCKFLLAHQFERVDIDISPAYGSNLPAQSNHPELFWPRWAVCLVRLVTAAATRARSFRHDGRQDGAAEPTLDRNSASRLHSLP